MVYVPGTICKALSADYDFDPSADCAAEVSPGPYLLGSPASTLGWAAAGTWPVNKIPDEYRTDRALSVETPMPSGTLDVSTPRQNAREQLLPFLENGEQVVLAEFAHTGDLYYDQPEATRHLLTTFFATGVVDSSRYQPNAVSFEPSWGMPLVAMLVVGGAVLAVVAIGLFVFVVFRLVKRLARR